jgi:hypothetical protein
MRFFPIGIAMVLTMFAFWGSVYAQETGDGENETPPEKTNIFSYEEPVRKESEERRWFLTLSGWYERKTGNTDTLKTNGQVDLVFDDNISEFRVGGRIFYGENAGEVNEHRATSVIKYDHYFLPRLELFIFSQSDYNVPAKLSFRNNSGSGVKLTFFRNAFWKMDASGAPVYQYEDYETRENTDEFRWSFRYRVNVTPVSPVTLSLTAFYIPRMAGWRAYRSVLDATLAVSITKLVTLKAGFLRNYNRNALPGTRKLDDTAYAQVAVTL